jgi:hypothetical protein
MPREPAWSAAGVLVSAIPIGAPDWPAALQVVKVRKGGRSPRAGRGARNTGRTSPDQKPPTQSAWGVRPVWPYAAGDHRYGSCTPPR